MTNRQRLRDLLLDVFLLDPDDFTFELRRSDIDTWDSLGVVSLGVGLEEVFGVHPEPAEATGFRSIPDVVGFLKANGIDLDA